MAIEVAPLPVPSTADASKLKDFGREVKGVNPGALSPEEFQEIHDLLYKVCTISLTADRVAQLHAALSTVLCSSAMSRSPRSSSTP